MSSRLLLVDLQNDYLKAPGLDPSAGATVAGAKRLLAGWRRLGLPVAHLWTTVSRADDRRMPHWRRQGRWLCEEGTPGHAPPAGLEPAEGETILHKTAFGGALAPGGELEHLLDEEGSTRLVVAGVHLHACVRQAVVEAYGRGGVEIWVAEDATASDDPVHAAITRRYLEARAARFLEVDALLGELEVGSNGGPPSGARVRAAAETCESALADWQATGIAERGRFLAGLADRLEPEAGALAREMALELGKPVRYGEAEVRRAAQMLRKVAERAEAEPADEPAQEARVRRRPLGVVAVITPWNNPVLIPLGKLAPALAFGNAVLWKPAPAAQAISERLMALMGESGFPPGIVRAVNGGRREAEQVMADPAVRAVSLTGGSLAGATAQEVCARRHVPLQAELGGNNAALVWADADLPAAAAELAEGAFAQAGQRCTANRRVVVHTEAREELVELLRREAETMAWGDPLEPATRLGPLRSNGEGDRVAALVERAGEDGAQVLRVERDPPARGAAWHPPTIVTCGDPAREIVQSESFGPLLVVQEARDWEDAMALVNGVRQGLAAALFSPSAERRERFLAEADAGILKFDRSTADAEVDVPFGGWKASGVGPPEHGAFDRDFYTRPQVVYGA